MARWHEALSDKLKLIGLCPYKADPDLWMRDVRDHYEYITVYYEDLLLLSKYPTRKIIILNTQFSLKVVVEP